MTFTPVVRAVLPLSGMASTHHRVPPRLDHRRTTGVAHAVVSRGSFSSVTRR
ncbi:hypothetical protein [Streptomyces sp. NPDC020141]|uniref:hypothetical protein n=1 Tax=Streptomyces sp. NPDC020141 TaxID=3365065 RepID=UPI00378F8E2A